MRKYFLLWFLGLVSGYWGGAQTGMKPVQPVYIRTGVYSLSHTDAFSSSVNQAALAQQKVLSIGVYSEQRFLLKELQVFQGAIILPTQSGNFGIHTLYFGNTVQNQFQLGLAYGRKLGTKADIGAQFNFFTLQTQGYGKGSGVNVEAGLILHFTEQLHGGIHFTNPVSIPLGKGREKLNAVYSTGLGYDASEQVFIGLEVQKTAHDPINIIGSLQYKLGHYLIARGGITTNSSQFFIGCGVVLKNIRIDVMASVHQQLGFSPGLLLVFQKPANK